MSAELGIARDRYGRPLVTPPGAKKATGYTRPSTLGKILGDPHNLLKWKLRAALIGVATRKDLLLQLQTLDLDNEKDKETLDQIAKMCHELGGGTKAATTGTAMHKILETHDRGQYVMGQKPPAELTETIETYQSLIEACNVQIIPSLIETFMVNDEYRFAGSPDRVVIVDGVHYIFDIKTGKSLKYGGLEYGMQLAAYAHCTHTTTNGVDRHELPPINQSRALIAHVPSNALHHVSLHWVDIENGWEAVQLAFAVRDMRNLGKKFILNELTPAGPPIDELPISDGDFQQLKMLLNGLPGPALAAVQAAWPAHIPTPRAHAKGTPILRGHAPEIHQLINKQRIAS